MKAPNIFKFATKELSQDAFLCWLFSFANKEYKDSDYNQLNVLATKFIQKLVDDEKLKIESIEVKKQIHKIDIWVEINEDILLIIEDKTDSKAGVNQLEKYYEAASKEALKRKIFAIYFKTGNESEYTFNKSNTFNLWKAFKIGDIVQVLLPFQKKITHPFYSDYLEICLDKYNHLSDFEQWIRKDNLNQDINEVVEAFYIHLEKDSIYKFWDYGHSRGAKTYYSNNYIHSVNGNSIYPEFNRLELKLVLDLDLMGDAIGKKYKKFKLDLAKRNIELAYNELFDLFYSKVTKLNLLKPKKYSRHNFLKFAVIPSEQWMVFNDDDTFNYQSSKKNIEKINKLVAKVIKDNKEEILTIITRAKEYK